MILPLEIRKWRDEMKTNEWTLDEIKRAVCIRYAMPECIFDGSKRFASKARCMAAYLARKFTSKSLLEIQEWLCLNSQDTVLHMVMRHKLRIDEFRTDKAMSELKTQNLVGYSCDEFFERKNGVAEMPLPEYVDLMAGMLG